MDKLKAFLNQLCTAQQELFCAECGTTLGYLRKSISVGQCLGAALCVAIERASQGVVNRRDLRPKDWHLIWPELAQQKEVA
ncbi:YdaS family helix-turn-helix protein [Burkholderia ubonensis]|uniref:YdaS family helix-turn-helix protein n=1 Tax=Burkholderia ubonensis TaxID=101571 RepID=UPI0009B40C2E